MKLTILFVVAAFLQAQANSQTVVLHVKNEKIERVFKEITKQTGYVIVYNTRFQKLAKTVTINADKANLNEVLRQCFENQPFTYEIQDKLIVLKERPAPKQANVMSAIELPELPPLPPTVKGRITNENGEAVPSVTITVKGGKVAGITDAKGEFVLTNIANDAVLIFTSVNMQTLEVKLNGRTELAFSMTTKTSQLDEIVMIGYGTTSKRDNTASISSITAEEIQKQPVQNPLNALQGRVSGALVTQSNGLPGSRVTIQIRGVNSIDNTSAGTQPLYIVDGVPFNITDNAVPANNDLNGRGSFAASGGLSPFALINPSDIERIDILKDADATAIYGTRGANGVVLITTKKGKAGKTKLDVNLYTGQGKVGHFIPMMNTQQYLKMRADAYANDGVVSNATNAPDLYLWDQNAYTDWQKKYLGGTADVTDAQASVSGGDQRTRFLLNSGYHRETPVFPGQYKSERISSRLNIDHSSLDKKFNANVSVMYSADNTNLLNRDLSTLYNLPPNMPLNNPDGSLFWNANFVNPESYLFVKYFGKTYNLMSNIMLRYTILPGLDLKASIGYNNVHLDQNTQSPALSKNPLSTVPTNSATFAYIDQKSYIIEPQLTYNRNISDGKFSALLGGTFQSSTFNSVRLSGDNYSTSTLLGAITGAGTVGTPGYNYTLYKYNSVFGRVTYNWKSKYLINGVVRTDGSSRFGPGKRFGTFWDIGTGWVFSNENFFKSLKFVSFGKLRVSYGLTGNDQIQDYLYRAFFASSGTYQNSAALAPNRIDNPDLHWQNTYKLEFGLDLAFLNRKIELTANYYRNRTPDQLGFLNLSSQTGFNSYASNFDALIQNTGIEFELTTRNINKKDFTWTTSFNITIPRTRLVSASPTYFYYNQQSLGQPLSYVLRYQYRGVDPTTGRPMYKDFSKDSLTFTPNSTLDRNVIGFSATKYFGGMNNVITYKGFELSFFFQLNGQNGNAYPTAAPGILSNGNQTTYWLNNWAKPGDMNAVPRYTTTSSVYSSYGGSDAAWSDISSVRLRTVNISYSFPQSIKNKLKVDNLRVYLQGQNLWWASKNKYVYDPETGTAMPPLRVITAGINVSL